MPKPEKLKFDGLILSKTRLGIISVLISGDKLDFTCLRNTLNLSDGNLSVHIRKLEEAGYIKVEKIFVNRKPKTFCKITDKGHQAIQNLIKQLEDLQKPDTPQQFTHDT
jgi:DNA-binding MarR family transcriptional regulator